MDDEKQGLLPIVLFLTFFYKLDSTAIWIGIDKRWFGMK
jgi:hypothetical protein